MSAWAETTLKKVAEKISYGYTASATEQNTGVKFLRITDIASGPIDWDTVPYCEISETDIEKCGLSEGEIVIARTGATVGYAKQIRRNPPHSVFASYLVRVRLKDNVCKRFVGILTESDNYKYYINTIAGGSAQPNANAQDLCSYPFYLPPIHVQQKVAAILSAYDELIENNQRRIALLEKMAEEIYREWFVRLRFPGREKVKFLRGLPQGWRVAELSELASVNSSSVSRRGNPESILYVDISSVSTNRIDNVTPYASADAPGRARRRVEHGDVIWSSVRPANRAYSLIYEPPENLIVSTGFAVIRPNAATPFTFLFFAVTSNPFVDQMTTVAKGAAYPATSFDDFEKAKLLVPSDDLLKNFHEKAAPMFRQKHLLQQQSERLRKTFDMLLPRLISGKLSVENLDIQFPPSMEEPVHET